MMTINFIRPDVRSFVACLLLDGGTVRVPITEADAAYTMAAWNDDGVDYPDNMTPAMLADAWNTLL